MKAVVKHPVVKNRVIRVFISSTFQDMKEEREELVKRVFPKLRKMCESRGVIWGEVDLRWGITDEQKAEGKVLPICLKEIDECRPYFIGMLGEKYGWIPLEIADELIEQEPWLEEHREKSVTELEIIHGVLNNPEMADHAYFYFRDPHYVHTQPAEKRADLVEGPTPVEIEKLGEEAGYQRVEERREKLRRLKDRIRSSGRPVREDYENPQQLGELVLEDFTKLIDELFPEDEELDPLDREAADHDAFAQSRFKVYIRRQEYFDRLNEHVDSDSQPLVVLGESGSGKSALLANWIAKYRDEHPDNLVIVHFIGATPYSGDWAAMLRRIMGEFKRRFDIQQDIPTEPDKLRSAFATWLHMASAAVEKEGRKIVLILDALNQLEDRDQAPDLVWLPPSVPENIRVILSTLPGRPLDDLEKREWPTMETKLLDDDERRQLIHKYLAQYRKSLNEKRVERIASEEQTHNPLFLRALLEELRLFGEHALLDERIDYYMTAKRTDDLYEKILERYEEDYERDRPGLVRDVMTLLWASRRGLSEGELLTLLGEDDEPLPAAVFAPLFLAAEHSFVSRSGLIGFFHDYMRQAVEDRYLPTAEDQQKRHLHLAEYFATLELGPRVVDEQPWQLAEAESWQGLSDLLTDLEFFEQAWQENQFEVKRYWAKIEGASTLRPVDAYKPLLDAPDEITDGEALMCVSALLNDTGYPSEALLLWQILGERFRQTDDLKNLATCLRSQGVSLWKRDDLDGAIALFKEQEHISRELDDPIGLEKALGNRAVVLKMLGRLDEALALHKEEEQICRKIDDKIGLAASLGNQGDIYIEWGDLDKALTLLQEQELIYREFGDQEGISRSLNHQGIICFKRGEFNDAAELFRQYERISRVVGNKEGIESAIGNLAAALNRMGNMEEALSLYKEKEKICREIGSQRGVAMCLANRAQIKIALGENDEAMDMLVESENILRKIGDRINLVKALGAQAVILKEQRDFDGAMRLLNENKIICQDLGLPSSLAETLRVQAEISSAQGDLRAALQLTEEALELADQHGYVPLAEKYQLMLNDIRSKIVNLENKTQH